MTAPFLCKPHQSAERLTATKWTILENLKYGWDWKTNLYDWDISPMDVLEYLWLVSAGYIRDGKITEKGLTALMLPPVVDAC